MGLTAYRLVLFIPRSRNIPAAASAVWPQRGSRAAPAQLRSLFSSSCRASARNSPSNYSLMLSLQLSRFPGSSVIAHMKVAFNTCTARTISELPRRTGVPPLHQRAFIGFSLLWSWCPVAGGQREPMQRESGSTSASSQN